jgi:uncharacterized membrane protein HdeD (DUF308 family)
MATDIGRNEPPRLSREASRVWGKPLIVGALLIALGIIAIGSATATGVTAVLLIGAALGAAGLVQIFHSFGIGDRSFRPLAMLSGLLALVVGAMFVLRPMAGTVTLGLLLAAYFFAGGLFYVVTSLMDRYEHWGWDLAYGLCAIVLGVFVVAGMPITSAWMIGMLVGIGILTRGIVLSGVGFALRRALRHSPAASPA